LLHWTIDVGLQTVVISQSLAPYSDLITLYTGAVAVASTIVLVLLLVRRLKKPVPLVLYPTTFNQS
ncbi:MAG: hypothetical protein ACREBQ_10805, partial [Nitrososphaerales archaeon]